MYPWAASSNPMHDRGEGWSRLHLAGHVKTMVRDNKQNLSSSIICTSTSLNLHKPRL